MDRFGEMGDGLGQFARVKGIAIDRDDRLYVVDAMAQVVQIFDANGKLLTWFGEPGTDRKIQNLPAKVLVDYEDVGFFQSFVAPGFKVEHLVIVINQIGVTPNLMAGGGQDKGPDFSVNGRMNPYLTMLPGEVKLWRIVNTSSRFAGDSPGASS
jgi:hypothetical protein